jgi:CheY-like chemotaxis protein
MHTVLLLESPRLMLQKMQLLLELDPILWRVKVVRERLMREHKLDLVLLYITMPVLDGMGLLEQMLVDPNLKDIPVVLLTASSYSKEQTHQSQFTVHQKRVCIPPKYFSF